MIHVSKNVYTHFKKEPTILFHFCYLEKSNIRKGYLGTLASVGLLLVKTLVSRIGVGTGKLSHICSWLASIQFKK